MVCSRYMVNLNIRAILLDATKVGHCFCWHLIITLWVFWKGLCGLFPSPKHPQLIVGWIEITFIESKNHPLGTTDPEDNHTINWKGFSLNSKSATWSYLAVVFFDKTIWTHNVLKTFLLSIWDFPERVKKLSII